MLRGSNPAKRQQWTERLGRFAKSGQSVAEFCRDEQISTASFYQWKHKLAGIPANGRKQPRKQAHRLDGPPSFKPLLVSPANVLSGVRICFPNGMVIDVGSDLPVIEKIVAQLLAHQAAGAR